MENNSVVLVIDDDIRIQRLLKTGLRAAHFATLSALTAAEALTVFKENDVDLILLDIGLPDRSGLDLLAEIRKTSPIPVIVLSTQGDEDRKLRAFDIGADDYVTKPFGMAELAARLRTALKYRLRPEGPPPLFVCGDLEIDFANRDVRRGGANVNLTNTEFEILRLLAKHPGKVLTHDFILRNIRGGEKTGDHQYLRVYMGTLRRKLGDHMGPSRIIRTETGIGYCLTVPTDDNSRSAVLGFDPRQDARQSELI